MEIWQLLSIIIFIREKGHYICWIISKSSIISKKQIWKIQISKCRKWKNSKKTFVLHSSIGALSIYEVYSKLNI